MVLLLNQHKNCLICWPICVCLLHMMENSHFRWRCPHWLYCRVVVVASYLSFEVPTTRCRSSTTCYRNWLLIVGLNNALLKFDDALLKFYDASLKVASHWWFRQRFTGHAEFRLYVLEMVISTTRSRSPILNMKIPVIYLLM